MHTRHTTWLARTQTKTDHVNWTAALHNMLKQRDVVVLIRFEGIRAHARLQYGHTKRPVTSSMQASSAVHKLCNGCKNWVQPHQLIAIYVYEQVSE